MVFARGWWEEGIGSCYLKPLSFSVESHKEFWRRVVVMVHNNMNVLNTTELCTYKWLEW